MIEIVREEPYEFVPPIESDFWCWVFRQVRLRPYLRKVFKVETFECRGIEKFRASIDSGAGIILAGNHSRLADPLAAGILSGEARTEMFAMASWHLFKEDWLQTWFIRRMGAFSVYREGNDRQAVNQAIDILVANRRPLLIFPEGAVSRHCDILMELMDGPGFIARQASKRRAKEGKGPVVIHPVVFRYSFDGDPVAAIEKDLSEFEELISWRPQRHLSVRDRLKKLGAALLTLKEVEYLGEPQQGDPHARAQHLVATVLRRLEEKWNLTNGDDPGPKNVVSRVKKIRTALLPDMIEKKLTEEQRADRWRDLAACYYLQQIVHYPKGYLNGEKDLPERVLETFERMLEDFQDRSSYHGPLHCTMVVDDPIEVSPERDRGAKVDPAMAKTAERLQSILDDLVAERRAKLFGEAS